MKESSQKGSSIRVTQSAAIFSPSLPFKRESPFWALSEVKTSAKMSRRLAVVSGERTMVYLPLSAISAPMVPAVSLTALLASSALSIEARRPTR